MGFVGSHVWQIRESGWGKKLLVMPGISGFIRNEKNEVLFGLRTDTKSWGYIGGYMEPGDSAETTLAREVMEETGLLVTHAEMVGVMTNPKTTYIKYPNGHEVQCPGFLFDVRASGDVRVGDNEHSEWGWFPIDKLPSTDGLAYAGHATRLYLQWLQTKQFQIG